MTQETTSLCETCASMERQDALMVKTLEVVHTIHNPCAPVTHYECRCRVCNTYWLALEVYDEEGTRPSEWSWERSSAPKVTP